MGTLPTIFCSLIVLIAIIAFGIYMTGARMRYVSFMHELRRTGAYDDWAEKHRVLLVLEKVSVYAVLLCFLGFLITGMLNYLNVSQLLFSGFVIFLLTGIVASFLLTRKVPADWGK